MAVIDKVDLEVCGTTQKHLYASCGTYTELYTGDGCVILLYIVS